MDYEEKRIKALSVREKLLLLHAEFGNARFHIEINKINYCYQQ